VILSVHRLKKTYDMGGDNVVRALDGVDLEVERGEFMAIMGPSGSGKSTLLNLVGMLDRPDSGTITIDSIEATSLPAGKLPEIRGRKVGLVFQTFNLVTTMTAVENVELPLRYARMSGKTARQRSLQLLSEVGLEDKAGHLSTELSGGEAQRVAIARALALDPAIVLADEPTGQLDSRTSQSVIEMMRALNQRKGQTFIIVTHDPGVAAQADRIVRMIDGRIESDGPTGAAPQLQQEEILEAAVAPSSVGVAADVAAVAVRGHAPVAAGEAVATTYTAAATDAPRLPGWAGVVKGGDGLVVEQLDRLVDELAQTVATLAAAGKSASR